MKKEFEARYSRSWPTVMLGLSVVLFVGTLLLRWLELDGFNLWGVFFGISVAWILLILACCSIGKHGVAVEITDEVLILHKKRIVKVPLSEIKKASVHVGSGSFDLCVTTEAARYSMHCFIEEQGRQSRLFAELLEGYGIPVHTYQMN